MLNCFAICDVPAVISYLLSFNGRFSILFLLIFIISKLFSLFSAAPVKLDVTFIKKFNKSGSCVIKGKSS